MHYTVILVISSSRQAWPRWSIGLSDQICSSTSFELSHVTLRRDPIGTIATLKDTVIPETTITKYRGVAMQLNSNGMPT